VIAGDSDDLIHELVLQPRRNTHYDPEDNKDRKGESQNFEADRHKPAYSPPHPLP
jgi:hypothetical protein